MSVIAYIDVAKLVDDANFPSGMAQAIAIAVIAAESGRNTTATGYNYKLNPDGSFALDANGNKIVLSIDRGLCQINNVYHPEVSDDCAYDATCSAKAMFTISNSGTDFTPWSTYNNGAYQLHIEAAKVAIDGWARIRKLNSQVGNLADTVDGLQTQLTTATDQVTSLQAQVTSLQGQVADLQSKLTTDDAKLASDESKIAAAEQDLSS